MSGGEADPLIQRLRPALDDALHVDLAIAFIFDAGVTLLHDRLVDILRRPSSVIRIITGDYQGVTEPNALRHLLTLSSIATPNASEPTLHLRAYRVKPDRRDSFHPKVWIVRGRDKALAWIGSSNMSETALKTGLEWSYEIATAEGLVEARAAFDELWQHPATEPIDADWIDAYERNRRPPTRGAEVLPFAVAQDAPVRPVEPRPGIQSEALLKLEQTRQLGERAGLVVLATGLGKTYVSAFDSQPFRRVLFVAHREEILTQALETFRKVRPSARLGLYHGTQKDPHADVLFASIQTLSLDEHLESFEPTHFDYVVIDEFHHAAAETYRRVLDYFEPKFLLGLTATPDRTDGANILSLCGGNEVYRADMPRGIEDGQLSAFRYFGIGDPTEYEKIPWRAYTNDRLTATVAIESRAQHILESLETHAPGRVRALAFCVTTGHADFMAKYFWAHGRACAAVYAGSEAPRTASLESLARGDLEIVFCVDMFNEGVDIPNIDTVMMLRPTQSSVVWLQQLGRGLRHVEGKTLTVLDFIGNHEVFGRRPEMLFETLKITIATRDEPWRPGFRAADLPPGVEIQFDLEAQDILTQLRKQSAKAGTKAERWYAEFYSIHGTRPNALEAWRAGWLKDLSGKGGGWLAFVASRGHLEPDSLGVFEQRRPLLAELEALKEKNIHMLLVLGALLHLEPFPGRIRKRAIAEWIATRARRSPAIMRDLAVDATDAASVERVLETATFAELARLGGGAFFLHDAKFLDASRLANGSASALARLVGELVDLHLERWHEDVSKSSMKLPRMLGDDGAEIDARFDVESHGERTTVVFHSRGDNKSASAGARNTEYGRGLETILRRLGRAEIDIERIEVDSSPLIRRGMPISERTLAIRGRPYPLVTKLVTDHVALARAIGTAMRKIGQEPGASGGNDTKRLRITLVQGVPAGELWRRLRGRPA